MSWIARLVLIVSGMIASLFIAKDALNFGVIQMTIALLLWVLVVLVLAFWMGRRSAKTNDHGTPPPAAG